MASVNLDKIETEILQGFAALFGFFFDSDSQGDALYAEAKEANDEEAMEVDPLTLDVSRCADQPVPFWRAISHFWLHPRRSSLQVASLQLSTACIEVLNSCGSWRVSVGRALRKSGNNGGRTILSCVSVPHM